MSLAPERAPRSGFPPVTTAGWAILGAIVALGAILRGVLFAQPPGGFLAYNEGFYIGLAHRMQSTGVFSWFFKPLDFNNPPLYVAMLSTLYRFHVPAVVGGRLISVGAGIGSIVVTFLIGRLLYDERTGLAAAAVLAVMPGAVLVDHNIEVDSLFVFLLFSAVYFYVLSIKSDRTVHAGTGGVLLGLSILTKQPAILALPALALWEVWRTHGVGWARTRRASAFALAALAVGLSWYVWQLATSAQAFLGSVAQIGGRSSFREAGYFFWTIVLGRELMWMVFPLAAVVALAGLIFVAWERKAGDKLVLVIAATYIAYYVQYHFHSYYLLPLAPVVALAIGRLFMGLAQTRGLLRLRIALLAVLVVAMCFGSFMMMAEKKWGLWSPATIPSPATASAAPWLYVSPEAEGLFGPALSLIGNGRGQQQIDLRSFLSLPARETSQAYLLYGGQIVSRAGTKAPPRAVLSETHYRPVLFGYRIDVEPPTVTTNTQFFANPPWSPTSVGPPWYFGVERLNADSGWYLYDNYSFGR